MGETSSPIWYCVIRGPLSFVGVLFVSESYDGIETGRLACGPDSEDNPDHETEDDRDDHGQRVEEETPAGIGPYREGSDEAESDADDAAGQREDQGLDEELGHDVSTSGADGLADADLTRPLANRDEHDVHDPDPADEQRDRGDARQE